MLFYSRCSSVCPYPRRVDKRLHAGTAVLSTEMANGNRVSLKSHLELKAQYEKARRLGVPLRITFINDGVTATTIQETSPWFQIEWSKDSHLWIGKCTFGFDGGADLVHRTRAATMNSAKDGARHFATDSADARETERVTYTITNEQTRKKRIQFAESNECRTFLVDSCPDEFLCDGIKAQSEARMERVTEPEETVSFPPNGTRNAQDKKDMLLRSSLRDFLHWLENGGLKDFDSAERMEQIRKFVKQELESVSKELTVRPNDQSLELRKSDLNLRNSLLKIHANALHLIQLSKSLKDWARFQITIGKIDGIKPRNLQIVPKSNVIGEVFFVYESGRAAEQGRDLPCKQLISGEIVYDEGTPPYQFNYNSVLTKDRALEIRLSVVDENGARVSLGKIAIPLSELHQSCMTDQWNNLAFRAEPNHCLASGRVCLHCRRVALDPPDYVKKHEDACKRMKNVIVWIKRFQGDIDQHNRKYDSSPRLDTLGADVKVGNTNITLLHAGKFKSFPRLHLMSSEASKALTDSFYFSDLLERCSFS